jgi:hypothetical protein
MSDGAHLGYTAEQALKQVLGGELEEDEQGTMSAQEMRDWLLAAEVEHAMDSYGECSRYAGGLVLGWFLAHPYTASLDENTLYETMKEAGVSFEELGLTGFQWGWAVNAARRCVELPPIPNPAILVIDTDG